MSVAPPRDQPGRSPQGPAAPVTAKPIKPAAPAKQLPTGPPQPALQAIGFNGSISDFNHRVDAVVAAHQKVRGTRPTPGVALDLARSTVPVNHFEPMFTATPQLAVQARAQTALKTVDPNKELLDGLKQAIDDHKFGLFVHDNKDQIRGLTQDPEYAAKLHSILIAGVGKGYLDGDFESSIPLGGLAHILTLGTTQVANSLVHAPGGLYKLGKDVAHDVANEPLGGFGLHNPFASRLPGEGGRAEADVQATLQATKQDFKHPLDRPGFLALDVLGLLAPGARVAASGRALAAGDLGEAASALTKRAGGTYAIGREGAQEHVLLSENPFVAAAQKYRLEHRQAKLDLATVNGEKAPSGLLSVLQPGWAKDFLDEHLSFESKIGREADARRKVEHIVDTTISRELDHVTGGSIVQARVLARIPAKVSNGLTRGEQKAIQTLSFGVSPDEQIAFHERMIAAGVGDPKAHLRQIADLKLSKKILANPAPRGRFAKALELTQQVVAEMEKKKVEELGLSPVTRQARVAAVRGVVEGDVRNPTKNVTVPALTGRDDILRGAALGYSPERIARDLVKGSPEAAGEMGKPRYLDYDAALRDVRKRLASPEAKRALTPQRVRPTKTAPQEFPATGSVEPFYTKLEPRGKQKRPPSDRQGFYPTKPGPFGIPAPTKPAELTHEFTGKAITAGDFRIDATNLTSEAYARTVRAATVLNEHSRLWKSATDTPKSRFDVPIRDSKKIPDKLRSILGNMDEGVVTDAEAAMLPSDMRELLDHLYPPLDRAQREKIDGVKWIDERTIGSANEIPTRPGAAVKVMEFVNEPVRAAILFLRPAYALNALGNAGMLLFHQGLSAVPSMARAIGAGSELGDEAVRTIDALMGQGRSKSYTTAITPKLSHGLASAWNVVTDQAFRRSSFLYEARQLGYVTADEIKALVKDGGKDLVEIKRRANKAMVEFDNLTPFEKNTLRHIIFVYPWVSRSAVYTLRSVMEHPLKADFLAQLGQQETDSDPIFKNAPEWFKQTGYFPVGWTSDGKPKVVNPTSVNSFSTLGELVAVAGGGFGSEKYASFQDLLGPLPSFAIHGITGKDQYGNDYPDGDWIGAAKEVLGSLPQISALGRASKKNPTAGVVDPSKRSSIVAGFHEALKRTVFTPGWLDGYGSLLAGGLSPRGVDLPALAARYWRDATPEQRHQNELTLLDQALTVQAGLLKASVPDAVRQGVRVGSDIDFAYKAFQTKTGRAPTAKERAGILIDHLDAKGLLPDGQAAKFKKELAPLVAEKDIQALRSLVFDKYAGGDALRQWDDDIRLVASFKKPVFAQKTKALYAQGLVGSPVPHVDQEALYAYGRKYLTFTRKVVGIQDQIKAGEATTADLRAFEDANDKPVNGLPSFVRTAWSYLPPDDQKKAVQGNAVAAWSTLSSFEKELLGHKTDAKVTAGWAKLADVVKEQRAALARKGESFPAGYKRILAQYVQKYYDAPGLVRDFDFARQPLFARLESYTPIRKSPNADKWREILNVAKTYHQYLKSDGYDKAQVRQMWRDYVDKTVQPWIDGDKAFAAEVAGYGKSMLGRLIGG